jgi:hypothetical protein
VASLPGSEKMVAGPCFGESIILISHNHGIWGPAVR